MAAALMPVEDPTADGEAKKPVERVFPVTIKLKYPVEWGKDTVTEIVMRRGRGGDMKGISLHGQEIPADDLMKLAGRLAGQPSALIEKLDQDDIGEVTEIALDFFVKFLSTGKTRSAP